MSDSETAITRRWLDKVLVGAIGMVIALVGVVWGALASQVREVDKQQRDQDRRITVTEGDVRSIRDTVSEIKGDVKVILREVKK